MRIFGQKVNSGSVRNFGKKLGTNANIIGRKVLGTIDRLTPIASMVASATGHPEIGLAIEGGQILAHNADRIARTGVDAMTTKQKNFENKKLAFGDSVEATRDTTNALLRRD